MGPLVVILCASLEINFPAGTYHITCSARLQLFHLSLENKLLKNCLEWGNYCGSVVLEFRPHLVRCALQPSLSASRIITPVTQIGLKTAKICD